MFNVWAYEAYSAFWGRFLYVSLKSRNKHSLTSEQHCVGWSLYLEYRYARRLSDYTSEKHTVPAPHGVHQIHRTS